MYDNGFIRYAEDDYERPHDSNVKNNHMHIVKDPEDDAPVKAYN